LPEKFDQKLKLVYTQGIYLWVFTSRFLLYPYFCIFQRREWHCIEDLQRRWVPG